MGGVAEHLILKAVDVVHGWPCCCSEGIEEYETIYLDRLLQILLIRQFIAQWVLIDMNLLCETRAFPRADACRWASTLTTKAEGT
jgi:hypothetical protein